MALGKEAQETRTVDVGRLRRIGTSNSILIRVAIADACSVMRTGLIQTIEAEPVMRVVASAAHRHDLNSCLQAVKADVLVMDPVGMGDAPVPLVRDLTQAHPSLGVAVFSSIVDFVPELLLAGVHAYVAHKEPEDQLRLAIRAAKARQRFLSPLVQDYVDCYILRPNRPRLSPRELRCLAYIAQGLVNQAICLRMDVELRTIENYVSKIRAKTGCDTRMEMIAWYQLVYGGGRSPSTESSLIQWDRKESGNMTWLQRTRQKARHLSGGMNGAGHVTPPVTQ